MATMTSTITELENHRADLEAKAQVAYKDLADVKRRVAEETAKNPDGVKALLDQDSPAFTEMSEKGKAYDTLRAQVENAKARITELRLADAYGEPSSSTPSAPSGADQQFAAFAQEILQRKSAIEEVLDGDGYKALADKLALMGNTDGARLGQDFVLGQILSGAGMKALVRGDSSTSAGAFVVPERRSEYIDLNKRPQSILSLVSQSVTSSDRIEWVKQTTRPSSAAFVPEATNTSTGTKPEGSAAWEVISADVVNVAEWIPVTRRALRDAGRVQAFLEDDLSYDLFLALENSMITGDGTNDTFEGILNASGIGAYTQGTTDADENKADAIHRGITTARLQLEEPDAVALEVQDWEDIRLQKDDNGNYQFGPPSVVGTDQIWGKPAVATTALASGTSIVGNYRRGAELSFHAEGLKSYVADQHSDFLVKNIYVLLLEVAAAFLVKRPKCFTEVTFL